MAPQVAFSCHPEPFGGAPADLRDVPSVALGLCQILQRRAPPASWQASRGWLQPGAGPRQRAAPAVTAAARCVQALRASGLPGVGAGGISGRAGLSGAPAPPIPRPTPAVVGVWRRVWGGERVGTARPASLRSLRCRRAALWPLGRELDRGTWIRAGPPTTAFCPWAPQVAPQPPDGPLRARRSARRLPRPSVRRPPSFSPSPRREPSRSHPTPPNQALNSLK